MQSRIETGKKEEDVVTISSLDHHEKCEVRG